MTGCGKEMVPTESSETAVIKETIQITKKVQPTITETETEPEIEVLSPLIYSLEDLQYLGVINWNGYKFTYYSQNVLPGGELAIPGRHVNEGGYVSDEDGYIVLATSINVAKGTIFHTPFGYDGKIYDTCSACHEAWLDVYTQ